MKKIKLSKRLHKASEYVIYDQPIVDIGSDHSYLPIYLLQQNSIPAAIAGEIAQGPLQNAQEMVAQYALTEKISVRLGDGLQVINAEDELGTIYICGMGGLLIANILNEGKQNEKLPKEARLVLQPNNAESDLREWLIENHYQIVNEAILEENEKIYEIIVAEYTTVPVNYTEQDIQFGPKLMQASSEIFNKKWHQKMTKNEKILNQLRKSPNEEKVADIEEEIQQIKKVIS